MEQAYFSSEVAKSLGVGASTLRKYSLLLEEAGYHFDRGINNSRVFYQKDIIAIQRLVRAIQEQNMSIEAAVQLAVSHQSEAEKKRPASAPEEASHADTLFERIEQLEEQQQTLIEVNKELVKELAQHQRWMKEKIETIEHQKAAMRDRLLLNGLQQEQVRRELPVYRLSSIFSIFKRKKNEASLN
ncbi:helix-turn-helix domain-containing protein [Bacillus xiapuensis]|uniref:helix-turn-helix domain-containing protein n=1 Tax=Bacillus xiapuensis TaxID=2014075 RepID=UPI000C23AF7B|nr:hypothetical protein [Bacillus xiapuensis]